MGRNGGADEIMRRMRRNGHAETAARIRRLRDAAVKAGGATVSVDSLRCLEKLLNRHEPPRPKLSMSPDGLVEARWEECSDGCSLDIKFLDGDMAEFTVSHDGRSNDSGVPCSINGTMPLEMVLGYVAAHGADVRRVERNRRYMDAGAEEVVGGLDRGGFADMARHIERLCAIRAGNGEPVGAESLRGLANLMRVYNTRPSDFSVSDDGNVGAEWNDGAGNAVLTVRFLEKDTVRFTVRYGGTDGAERSLEGMLPPDAMMRHVAGIAAKNGEMSEIVFGAPGSGE